MWKTEVIIFLTIITAVIFVFIAGVLLFVFQYRKRSILYENEKVKTEKQHKLDMLNNQLRIQQQTMQFIGSEIHDSVTQKLTLASIYSQQLEFENQVPAITTRLNQISGIINDSLLELRDLSKTLTDNRIQHVSLTDLLNIECKRINDTSICKAILVSGFGRPMSVVVKSSLFRVIQEFIQNSLKHAACNLININLYDAIDGLEVNVSDNGKGFDSTNIQSTGIGLSNMKRRVTLIGGTFHLHSEPGVGTSLQLFIDNKNLQLE